MKTQTIFSACALLGGLAWMVSELIELSVGMNTAALVLTALFHGLLAIGVWGVRGRLAADSRLAGVATLGISLGFGAMVIPPAAVLLGSVDDIRAIVDAYPVFKLLGMAAVLGAVLLGLDGLLGKRFASPIAWVLIICPPVMAFVMIRGEPMIVANMVNILQSLAWMALGLKAHQKPR